MPERSPGIVVGGLPLPPALVARVRAGSWVAPRADDPVYRAVFHDDAESPLFYDEAKLLAENASWQRLSAAGEFGGPQHGDPGFDPARSVVIGDLGPDRPVVLDYRGSAETPRVLYLGPAGWAGIAASAEELIARLYPDDGSHPPRR
ncbi:hypothetical protein [Streptomyces sp. RFCAC02]|uniref:hypothetical protein n=1 Tax=Streptomyces sp. RFCAC02 TaxID=2499143 RepID=UPI00101EE6C1|nr:hypothetical protein [Streptomyces sp. RFCAC02]